MKKIYLLVAFILFGVMLTGCGSKNNSITASGSSALEPLAGKVAQMFQNKYPKYTVTVQGGGSGTGLANVATGAVNIGNSDVFANEKLSDEQAKGLVDHQVCVVAFAAVVNSDVTIDSLTKDQLIKIFTGQVTNWKDVGGPNEAITLISRPDSSGTKATFDKYGLDGEKETTGTLTQDSSGTVKQAVQTTPGAISYLASSYLISSENKTGIRVLNLDFGNGPVAMNKANVTSGAYEIWSYEHMYTKGEATGVTKEYIDFFNTDAVKELINQMGYYSGSDMQVTRNN